MHLKYLPISILVIAGIVGCSGDNLVTPQEECVVSVWENGFNLQSGGNSINNRHIWGIWSVTIGADANSFDIIPVRGAAIHLNTLKFLEQTPCTDCLGIGGISFNPPDKLSVDITIKHPFPGLPNLSGFDVRGILITGSDFTFPACGRTIALGDTYPRMAEPDGFTSLFNPIEFPDTGPGPPALKYIPGKFAHEGDFTAALNPFRAYAVDSPRRVFTSGGIETQTITLISTNAGSGSLEFGYAVDVSWEKPPGPVVDPVTDFPLSANCLEAYRIDIDIENYVPLSAGGSTPVTVEVYDHQGKDTIHWVSVEAPDLFIGEVQLDFSIETGYGSFLYTGTIQNTLLAASGEYPILARVVDTETDINLGQIDAWQIEFIPIKRAWVCTWGNTETYDRTEVYGVECDMDGNVYIAGSFEDTVDFDPGPGVEERTAPGVSEDAYLLKFSSNGEFQWVGTWGSESDDFANDLAIDGQNRIYVSGGFRKTVDFDPGPGETIFTSIDGMPDAYISKFNSNGDFLWTKTWGGPSGDRCYSIACTNLGDIYAIGHFRDIVDFDPGPGEDFHETIGSSIFLVKYNSNGIYNWGLDWDAECPSRSNAVDVDELGNVFVTGVFKDSVDFDPGDEVDINESNNGTEDAFLSCFDSEGIYKWAATWGSDYNLEGDQGLGVAADGEGNAYAIGKFWGSVDFYPGSPIDWHLSHGGFDISLSKYNNSWVYWCAKTWGGIESDAGNAVAVDSAGFVYTTGYFQKTVDFNKWGAQDEHTSNGDRDVFVSVFNKYHTHQWAQIWGGTESDAGLSITVDNSGNVFVVGKYWDEVDFDPGPGTEYRNSFDDGCCFLVKLPPGGEW